MNFYDRWLAAWDESVEARRRAPKVTHEEDIDWVTTPQDHHVGLLVAPELGFLTWGSETLLAEIPPGCHTGRHKHGEEAIHIVRGAGFSVIDGLRYDWRAGGTMVIPFGAEHQHFNTGDVTVRYLSAMSVHLEMLCGVHRTTQLAVRGEASRPPDVHASPNGMDARGRRIHLPIEEAPVREATEDEVETGVHQASDPARGPMVVDGLDGYARSAIATGDRRLSVTTLMRVGRPINRFRPMAQEISSILSDTAGGGGSAHAHMEAHLYVLDGSGHSVVDGETIPWRSGSALHIQGPRTVHRHVVESESPSRMLRIAPGIRYFMERMAKDEFPYLFYGQTHRPEVAGRPG